MKGVPPKNEALARQLNRLAWLLSAMVLILVAWMRRIKIPLPQGWDLSFLPGFHAVLNTATAMVLLMALWYVKKGDIMRHRKAIYVALSLSVLFLLSYVTYHFFMPETLYGDLNGDGVLSGEERAAVAGTRGGYLFLLLSHIALAALTFPFILFTFIRGYTGQIKAHKRMARWVWPFWFYVAVTGPLVYLMLRPYYGIAG